MARKLTLSAYFRSAVDGSPRSQCARVTCTRRARSRRESAGAEAPPRTTSGTSSSPVGSSGDRGSQSALSGIAGCWDAHALLNAFKTCT